MSMRMDRVMNFGEAYSLEIVAAMINSLNAKKVYIYEPHSFKTTDLIKNSVQKIRDVDYKENYTIIFPDSGAAIRYHAELYRDIIFQKKRNLSDGRIISLEPVNQDLLFKTDKPFLIVDDLCDGGMTFKLIAEYLDKACPGHKRDINIIHMVNPKGIQTLSAHYDNVYITETYKNWSKEDLPSNVFVSEI
jgi:ribose-phosphate pyrophosphokinase